MAFIIFSLFIVVGTMMIQGQNDAYGLNTSTSDFAGVYNTMNETSALSMEFKNRTLDSVTDTGTSWDSLTQGSYSAVRLMTNTFKLFTGITTGIAAGIGVTCGTAGSSPVCLFVDAAFICFIVAIVFSLIYMIFRFRP